MGIKVENITHIYEEGLPDESVAIQDVSFELNEGDFAGIIGHTGSGKSTLLQHLNGLLKPKTGRIIIDGVEITGEKVKMTDIRKKIGIVFQYPEYQLFEETVALDVAFGPGNLGLSKEEISARVKEAIELVGLDYDEVAEKSPFELSGGQKRRAAIAGVVAMKPHVLILDEPTAGLDPKTHRDILQMIMNIHRHENNITVLVSHNMADVAEFCTKVLVMNKGKMVMQGTPTEVFLRHEQLKEIGLSAPPISEFLWRLRDAGLKTDKMTFDIDEAAKIIAGSIGKEK